MDLKKNKCVVIIYLEVNSSLKQGTYNDVFPRLYTISERGLAQPPTPCLLANSDYVYEYVNSVLRTKISPLNLQHVLLQKH